MSRLRRERDDSSSSSEMDSDDDVVEPAPSGGGTTSGKRGSGSQKDKETKKRGTGSNGGAENKRPRSVTAEEAPVFGKAVSDVRYSVRNPKGTLEGRNEVLEKALGERKKELETIKDLHKKTIKDMQRQADYDSGQIKHLAKLLGNVKEQTSIMVYGKVYELGEIKELEDRIQALEESKRDDSAHIAELRSKLGRSITDCTSYQEKNKELEERVAEKEIQRQNNLDRVVQLFAENGDLKVQVDELKSAAEKHAEEKLAAEYNANQAKGDEEFEHYLNQITKRMEMECQIYEMHRYPKTFIKVSKMALRSAEDWSMVSGPCDVVDRAKEPDSLEYDTHKYLALFTAGRNLAAAAQKIHEEVMRTVERMTDRYIINENTEDDTMSCPILKNGMPFKDPVLVGSGITFERSAIEDWFQRARDEDGDYAVYKCPMTRKQVFPENIQSNVIVKQMQENRRTKFKADYPTKFTTSIDIGSLYGKTPAFELDSGEKVPGDFEDDDGNCYFPPSKFNPLYYCCMDDKINFSFD